MSSDSGPCHHLDQAGVSCYFGMGRADLLALVRDVNLRHVDMKGFGPPAE